MKMKMKKIVLMVLLLYFIFSPAVSFGETIDLKDRTVGGRAECNNLIKGNFLAIRESGDSFQRGFMCSLIGASFIIIGTLISTSRGYSNVDFTPAIFYSGGLILEGLSLVYMGEGYAKLKEVRPE